MSLRHEHAAGGAFAVVRATIAEKNVQHVEVSVRLNLVQQDFRIIGGLSAFRSNLYRHLETAVAGNGKYPRIPNAFGADVLGRKPVRFNGKESRIYQCRSIYIPPGSGGIDSAPVDGT